MSKGMTALLCGAAITLGIILGVMSTKFMYILLDPEDWMCGDARMSSLELPLKAECYNYKHKAGELPNAK